MESPGFEPGTLRMQSGCDTTTPHSHDIGKMQHTHVNAYVLVSILTSQTMKLESQDSLDFFESSSYASLAQSVARRSHNPKVVSSILTRSIYLHVDTFLTAVNRLYGILVANHVGFRQNCRNSSRAYWRSGLRSVASSSSWNLNARAATLSEVCVFSLGLRGRSNSNGARSLRLFL